MEFHSASSVYFTIFGTAFCQCNHIHALFNKLFKTINEPLVHCHLYGQNINRDARMPRFHYFDLTINELLIVCVCVYTCMHACMHAAAAAADLYYFVSNSNRNVFISTIPLLMLCMHTKHVYATIVHLQQFFNANAYLDFSYCVSNLYQRNRFHFHFHQP